MKFATLTVLFCSLLGYAHAQKDSLHAKFIKNKCSRIHIHIMPSSRKNPNPPYFANFKVVDFRADTSRLGFWAENKSRRELVFETNTSDVLTSYLNKVFSHSTGTQSFLVIIKKLWLYDEKMNGSQIGLGRMNIRLEAFLRTPGGLVPYTYLDTAISSRVSIIQAGGFKVAHVLQALVDKIAQLDESTVTRSKNAFSFAQLDSMNRKKFMYAMDTATVLNAGVYANLEEFRNNRPSLFNYEIIPDENGLRQVYLKDEKGQSYFSHTIFGYCDGKQSYAMMDGNLFPIYSVQHAYYVFGSKEYKIKTTVIPVLLPIGPLALGGMMPISETAVRRLRFFNLDVYTGDIY
jgi:hypothetical protein